MIESLLKIGQLYNYIVTNYPDEKSVLDLVICEVTIDVIADNMLAANDSMDISVAHNSDLAMYDASDINILISKCESTISLNTEGNLAKACSELIETYSVESIRMCLDTCFHEVRHIWQALYRPHHFFGNGYVPAPRNGGKSKEEYLLQKSEQDAVFFAEEQVELFIEGDNSTCFDIVEAVEEELEDVLRCHLVSSEDALAPIYSSDYSLSEEF